MSDSRSFVDTNILVYAYDTSSGDKRERARSLLTELWESGQGCVSVQVLQEFLVNVTRKVPKPLDTSSAVTVITDLSRWRVHSPGPDDVLAAIEVHRRQRVSFRDSMILRSAASLGCQTLYSGDLNPGQRYHGVRIHNPFVTS